MVLMLGAACSAPPKSAPVASTSSVAPARPSVPDSAERVARVERGLLPPVRFKDETVPWSLEERMRVHRVPGLVIAVFEDYRPARRADADIDPDARKGKGYGAVIMTNSLGSERLFGEVRRAIAQEYAWDGYGAPPLERKSVDVQTFAAFEGRWALGRGRGFSLSVRAGRLEMRRVLEDAEELAPVGDSRFVGRDSGARVTLEANGVLIEQEQPYAAFSKILPPERASRVSDPAAAPIFLLDADRFGEALTAYRRLLAANPNDPAATEANLNHIASRLYRTPHDASVLRIYRLIAELYPDSPEAQEYFADVLTLMGQRGAAIDAYNRGVAVKNRDKKASADDKARYAAFIARKIGRIPRT